MDPRPATHARKLLIALAVIAVLLLLNALFADRDELECMSARADPGLLAKLTPIERERCTQLLGSAHRRRP